MKPKGELFPSLKTRRYFTVTETARLLGISIPGIHLWISRGRLRRPPRVSRRGGYRIPRREIVRLLKSVGKEVPGLWTLERMKVLLIEDDRQVRAVVAAALRHCGASVHVETAPTPEDGLLLVARLEPDIILLDRFRPKEGMTSDQALTILRRAKEVRGARIIALWPSRGGDDNDLAPRPDAFLPKPFGIDDLRREVFGRRTGFRTRAARTSGMKADRRRWEFRVSESHSAR